MGKKFFYQSSSTVIPTTAYDNNMLAYVLDGYYHQCNDICICSIEGICYTQTSYYAKVILVPFCERMFSILVQKKHKKIIPGPYFQKLFSEGSIFSKKLRGKR